jgi:hypothetical protein
LLQVQGGGKAYHDVDPFPNQPLPVLCLPTLPEDPVPASSAYKLLLGKLDVLGGGLIRRGSGEDSTSGCENGGVFDGIAFFALSREEVAAIGWVGSGVDLSLESVGRISMYRLAERVGGAGADRGSILAVDVA